MGMKIHSGLYSNHNKRTKEFTEAHLRKIEEIREWLLQQIQQ